MKNLSLYDKAHLLVSCVRVLEYKNNGLPPHIKEISLFLDISQEEVFFVLRKLEEKDIVKIIEKNLDYVITINDHTLIESLPKIQEQNKLNCELEQFKLKQQNKSKEIEEFQKKQKEKQKQLFEKLNKELKQKNS